MTIDEAMQLAVDCHRTGHPGEAEHLCRQILTARPDHADATNLLGVLAANAGHNELAVQLIQRAIAIQPNSPQYHSNLGNLLRAMGRDTEAIGVYREAIRLDPAIAAIHTNLGCALARTRDAAAAVAAHREAIRLDPRLPEAQSNLGNALTDLGHVDEAIRAYRGAIALDPENAEVHVNLATCLLLDGNFTAGWSEYEWRLKCQDSAQRLFARPRWNGEDLNGKTILLHAEQGFGDTIQFVRYVNQVTARGGTAIVECQPSLIELLRSNFPATTSIPRDYPLPPFDFHCPLLSFPGAIGTTLTNIPPQKPPLSPPSTHTEVWKSRVAKCSGNFKVGLAWAGNPSHKNDHNRSLPLSFLDALAAITGVRFFSLQKQPAPAEIKLRLTDMTAALHDFADTAGLIEQLDLVISVDTAVAHLAGAMQKPVWLLLPFAPDWRWLRDRSDSPWYPTMRLFRQQRPGDWPEVFQRVAASLVGVEL